jgi:hypothetical protein
VLRERERLKVQRWPHYMKLAEGAYLGFRRGPDTWQARLRDRDGVQQYKALDQIDRDDYDGAKRAAEAWFSQMGGHAVRSVKRAAVRDALEAYLTDLKRHGRADAAREARGRFKLTVDKDPLADLALEVATRDDLNGANGWSPGASRVPSTGKSVRSSRRLTGPMSSAT